MISITGRRPQTALPKAAPVSASSEIGVSKTRSGPKRSASPPVVANTPPGGGDVLAEEDHALVARQLLVERVADRVAELAAQASLNSRCAERSGVGKGAASARAIICSISASTDGVHAPPAPESSKRSEIARARDDQRVAQLPRVELAGLAVAARVAARVADEAVGQRLDEAPARAPARARSIAPQRRGARTAQTSLPSTLSVRRCRAPRRARGSARP